MTRRRISGRAVAALLGVVLVLTGCTGVPTSSAPQTIKPVVAGGDEASPAMSPSAGAEPRELVENFLTANAIEPGRHASARTFLSPAARSRWTDTTVTIISNETFGTFKPGSPQVVVSGRTVGSLNSDGIYTPSLGGTGDGGALTRFSFTVKQVDGQYRINSLPPGLLLTTEQFQQTYKQHSLYFYDLSGRYLVPDLRWSGLQGTPLEQWLVTQLADGPSPLLQKSVNSDAFPTQISQRTISVKRGTATAIEIRGAQHLNSAGKDQLAAQLSYTLADASGDLLSITDNGKGVHIPAAKSAEFTSSSFDNVEGPITPQPDVYYLQNGRIRTDSGRMLTGPVNGGTYYLNSIGLERTGSSSTLNVAGVAGTGSTARLVVGTQRSGLHSTPVVGSLSRPAWVPGSSEVWVGDGRKLYRTSVGTNGRPTKPTPIALPPTPAAGKQVVALRVSPEGSRVAMVLASSGGGVGQLYVGSVVRSAGQVRIDMLVPVSPEGVAVTDVAWIEPTKLFAIGSNTASKDAKVFETDVDGSLWTGRQFTLPYRPDSVTFAVSQLAWVGSGGFVWVQNGPSDWQSPGAISQTAGYAPVYLE